MPVPRSRLSPGRPSRRSGTGRARRPMLPGALVLIALATALAACGSSTSTSEPRPAQRASFAGATNESPAPAAPLRLRDSFGRAFDLRDLRGKAVLVTFVYTHCPDVCPLIMGNLHAALTRLGPRAGRVRLVAVSTDPEGDTPRAVNAFLRAHGLTGRMRYLVGGRPRLERTWRAWGIAARRDKKDPELVEHSAPIYGIGASGRLLTLYPSNAKPAMFVHDVPLLAAR